MTHDGMRFQVDSVEGQRIDRLTVTFQPWHRRDEPAPKGTTERTRLSRRSGPAPT